MKFAQTILIIIFISGYFTSCKKSSPEPEPEPPPVSIDTFRCTLLDYYTKLRINNATVNLLVYSHNWDSGASDTLYETTIFPDSTGYFEFITTPDTSKSVQVYYIIHPEGARYWSPLTSSASLSSCIYNDTIYLFKKGFIQLNLQNSSDTSWWKFLYINLSSYTGCDMETNSFFTDHYSLYQIDKPTDDTVLILPVIGDQISEFIKSPYLWADTIIDFFVATDDTFEVTLPY
jgi:hypothetical protein